MRLIILFLSCFILTSSSLMASEVPEQHQARWYSKVSFVYRSQNLCFLSERDDDFFRLIRPEVEACVLNLDNELAINFEEVPRYSIAIVDQLPEEELPNDLFMINRLDYSKMNRLHFRYKIYEFLISRLISEGHQNKAQLKSWLALAMIYKDCRELLLQEDGRKLQRVIFNNFGADFLRDDLEMGKVKPFDKILKLSFSQESDWLSFRNSEYAFYAFRALKSSRLFKNFEGIKEAFLINFDSDPLKERLGKKTNKSLKKWFTQFLDMTLYSKHYPFPPQKVSEYFSKLMSFELLLPDENGDISLQNVNYDQLVEHEKYFEGKSNLANTFKSRLQILKLRSPVLFDEVFERYQDALEELIDEDYDDFAEDFEEAQELQEKKITYYKLLFMQMRQAEKEQRLKIFKSNFKSNLDDWRGVFPTLLQDYLKYLDSVKKWYN